MMRMVKIVLYRPPEWQSYRLIKNEPSTADLLANFLTDDVGGGTKRFIKDFEDDKDHGGAMNATQFTKEDGIVTITPEWIIDEDESIAKGHFFSIKAQVLADL